MSILRNLAQLLACAPLRRKLFLVAAELDEAKETITELRKELLRKDGQIERQADLFEEYRTEIEQLKQSLSGTREQLRQAHLERARALQEAAEAGRLA